MKFFNFHTHKYTNQADVLELVNQYPREFDASIPFYSIGIHPWYIVADQVQADLAIIDKRRPEPGKSKVMNIIGDVRGKNCIIIDDIIDSGGTIINAVDALKKAGAIDVYVFITHAVLSGDAAEKIKKSKIKKLIITDTIDNSLKIKNNSKIEVISIAPLMAEAISRISNSTSVSDLFN